MANGTMAADTGHSGGKKLTVTYHNGQRVQLSVLFDAPVVRFAPAQQSVVVPGAKAFVVASKPDGSNELSANFVAVGVNGLMPPM